MVEPGRSPFLAVLLTLAACTADYPRAPAPPAGSLRIADGDFDRDPRPVSGEAAALDLDVAVRAFDEAYAGVEGAPRLPELTRIAAARDELQAEGRWTPDALVDKLADLLRQPDGHLAFGWDGRSPLRLPAWPLPRPEQEEPPLPASGWWRSSLIRPPPRRPHLRQRLRRRAVAPAGHRPAPPDAAGLRGRSARQRGRQLRVRGALRAGADRRPPAPPRRARGGERRRRRGAGQQRAPPAGPRRGAGLGGAGVPGPRGRAGRGGRGAPGAGCRAGRAGGGGRGADREGAGAAQGNGRSSSSTRAAPRPARCSSRSRGRSPG